LQLTIAKLQLTIASSLTVEHIFLLRGKEKLQKKKRSTRFFFLNRSLVGSIEREQVRADDVLELVHGALVAARAVRVQSVGF
jgi:hypothetical protein